MTVGVLAVQGAVSEHVQAIRQAATNLQLDASVIEVRTPEDLARVSGIVLPGGESTTISRLLRSSQIQGPLLERAGHDLAVFGTCAGMILLASDAQHDVLDKDIELLGLLDATVDRNAFGRQRESCEARIDVDGLGPVDAVFIRAPSYDSVGPDTTVLAMFKQKIVAARNKKILATAFHPELTPDARFHELFLQMAQP